MISNSLIRTPLRILCTIICWLTGFTIIPTFSQSVSATYPDGDIATSLHAFDPTCNGPAATLAVVLPPGGPWRVDSIDIEYEMEGLAGGLRDHQRSLVRCVTTSQIEAEIYTGSGGAGTENYDRTGVTIANGEYPGGAELRFELRAWRTQEGTGCNTTHNRINDNTWTITVYYAEAQPAEPYVSYSVGVGTDQPVEGAALEIRSDHQAFLPPRLTTGQRNSIPSPVPGMMIYNTTSNQIEYYAQGGWTSLVPAGKKTNHLIGGTSQEQVYAVTPIPDGGYIMSGSTTSNSTGTFYGLNSNGNMDAVLVKLNQDGAVEWQKLYGGSSAEAITSVQPTSDGGFITCGQSSSSNSGTLQGVFNNGNFQTDGWIMKLDPEGSVQWQKLFGGPTPDTLLTILQTTDGGYIAVGHTGSANTGTLADVQGKGGVDVWVIKLNAAGDTEWQRLYGGSNNDWGLQIQPAADGGWLVSSTSLSNNSGDLEGLPYYGSRDAWFFKIDDNGNIEWQIKVGNSGLELYAGVCATDEGDFIVSCYTSSNANGSMTGLTFNGGNDIWIARLSAQGDFLWQNTYGGAHTEYPRQIIQTSDKGFLVIGSSYSSDTGTLTGSYNAGSADVVLIKLDAVGGVEWHRLLGGTNTDEGMAVCPSSSGGYIICARTNSSNTGALWGLTNAGMYDIWIVEVDKGGNMVK